jgi:hypothetical protein
MNANLKVRCSYWLENALVKNLGDYLGILVLEAMGYRAVGRNDSASDVVNPGRCLLPIGSVLSEDVLLLPCGSDSRFPKMSPYRLR